MKAEKLVDRFQELCKSYRMAIVQYAQASKSKSKELDRALRGILEGEYNQIIFPFKCA